MSINQYNDNEFENKNEIRKRKDKPLKVFGWICIAIGILAIAVTTSTAPDASASAKDALNNKTSLITSPGVILLDNDDPNFGQKDYTVSHNSNSKDAEAWIWDYAKADGDYIQILVDGKPLDKAFAIKNKPKKVFIPTTGKIQIRGIHDGDSNGITYAIRFDVNGTSYFNLTSTGKENTYTLVKK